MIIDDAHASGGATARLPSWKVPQLHPTNGDADTLTLVVTFTKANNEGDTSIHICTEGDG